MTNLGNIEEVKNIQQCMHKIFKTREGEEVIKFLEEMCGWYNSVFTPTNRDMVLLNDGKRQVLATIKTFLEYRPEDIVSLWQKNEG